MKMIAVLLAFVLSAMTIESSYAGSMLTTLEVTDGIILKQERENVITFMESKEVQKKMIAMGVNPGEAIQRVAALSPAEISKLSREIDKAPAGADAGVGTVIGAALFVFLILLITDILGFTNVFPFTKSVN